MKQSKFLNMFFALFENKVVFCGSKILLWQASSKNISFKNLSFVNTKCIKRKL